MSTLTRRQLLTGTAAAAAGLAVTRASAASFPTSASLPAPAASGIEHIVFLCMENQSFDHYLGWLPGAHARQAGLSYADDHGVRHATHHLTEFQGCGFNDPDHPYAGGRIQYAGGKLDGFRKGANDDYALGYYEKADLPFYGDFVGQSTVFDHWFAPILSATYPNRFYTHAARTDRIDNTSRQTSMPTIWDRLAGAGVPANYYFSDLPFLALWGEKYLPISKPVDSFFAEAASGTLPQFSYLDPFFLGEEQGGSNDDHPHADIRRGQAFVSQVAKAVATSPLWSKTALVITYDEWGASSTTSRHRASPTTTSPEPGSTTTHRPAFAYRPSSSPPSRAAAGSTTGPTTTPRCCGSWSGASAWPRCPPGTATRATSPTRWTSLRPAGTSLRCRLCSTRGHTSAERRARACPRRSPSGSSSKISRTARLGVTSPEHDRLSDRVRTCLLPSCSPAPG